MLGVVLPDEAVAATWFRFAIMAVVVVVGYRLRRKSLWPVVALILLAVAANIALLAGHISLSGAIGVPLWGMIAWLLIDFMRHDVTVLKRLLAAKEVAWSKERHDLLNDLAAERARNFGSVPKADHTPGDE